MLAATLMAAEATGAAAIDFTEALTTALNSISSSFSGYATVAIGVGLAIWGAPQALKLVKRFFTALTH